MPVLQINHTAPKHNAMQKKQYTQKELEGFITSSNTADLLVLYNLYSKAIYNVLLKMLPNEKAAQKALGEAFVKIYKERNNYNPAVCAPFTWMLRTAITAGMAGTNNKTSVALTLRKTFIRNPLKAAETRQQELAY
jgi:hypothetical protein